MPGFKRWPRSTPASRFKGSDRIACGERCEFEVDGGEGPREGIIWNLSVAGLYLVLQTGIPDVDAILHVLLWLPDDPHPIRADVQVVWRNPPSCFSGCGAEAPRFPPGCGLRFVDIAPAELERIRSRVESVYPNRSDGQSEQ